MPTRTIHLSSAGKTLYAVRNVKGEFKYLKSYKPTHGHDMKGSRKDESAATSTSYDRRHEAFRASRPVDWR